MHMYYYGIYVKVRGQLWSFLYRLKILNSGCQVYKVFTFWVILSAPGNFYCMQILT